MNSSARAIDSEPQQHDRDVEPADHLESHVLVAGQRDRARRRDPERVDAHAVVAARQRLQGQLAAGAERLPHNPAVRVLEQDGGADREAEQRVAHLEASREQQQPQLQAARLSAGKKRCCPRCTTDEPPTSASLRRVGDGRRSPAAALRDHAVARQPARLRAREHVAAAVAAGSVSDADRPRVDPLAVEVDEAEARRGTRGSARRSGGRRTSGRTGHGRRGLIVGGQRRQRAASAGKAGAPAPRRPPGTRLPFSAKRMPGTGGTV